MWKIIRQCKFRCNTAEVTVKISSASLDSQTLVCRMTSLVRACLMY